MIAFLSSLRGMLSVGCLIAFAIVLTQCSTLPTESDKIRDGAEDARAHNGDLSTAQESASNTARTCVDGVQGSGALYRICVPEAWNGDLVIWAHGYVAPNQPLRIPDDKVEGTTISEIVNQLGYAFATTSYSKNGLAVKQGVADVVDLVDIFIAGHGQPGFIYLVGASEGGLVTALAVERFPEKFDGGLPACGPIGNFREQIDYFGDFHVVFDYFFPGVVPGSPIHISQEVMDDWDAVLVPRIKSAIQSNPDATEQLLRVTRAPIDPNDPSSVEATVLGILWYNVFATNDAIEELGGQPFDNMNRIYFGSDDDLRLNREVRRFRADQAALNEIEAHYQTSGRLASHVVTIHTTGDPIVPYLHEPRYLVKVRASGSASLLTHIPIIRYGHCNFTVEEVLAAFAILVFKVTGQNLLASGQALPNADARNELLQLQPVLR